MIKAGRGNASDDFIFRVIVSPKPLGCRDGG
jgi:hypothetical protein